MHNIEKKIKKIIVEKLDIKEEDILHNASFIHDLGADSLDTVELIMALEDEFNIEISDKDAERITTIQEAVKFIKNNCSKNNN
ncbi:acyl carrier protein [Buchnera aphidicola]|uniref:acyl carrier protein n=1 Tax=Buchnera aphidicola TaxID=9 RepID=UPI003CE449B3